MPKRKETLKPANQHVGVPDSFKSLWSNVDVRREPLDVEIIKEWEEDDVVMKILRYRVGVFKEKGNDGSNIRSSQKPKKAPALVQIHGVVNLVITEL